MTKKNCDKKDIIVLTNNINIKYNSDKKNIYRKTLAKSFIRIIIKNIII